METNAGKLPLDRFPDLSSWRPPLSIKEQWTGGEACHPTPRDSFGHSGHVTGVEL